MAYDERGGPSAHTRLTPTGTTSATPHPHRLHPSSPHNPAPVSAISTLLSKEISEYRGNLDLTATAQTFARRELLGGGSFGTLGARPDPEDSPEDMQKKDPLATQVWRLYSKQKGTLPNAERMENLTWRMMALTLRRERYVFDAEAYAVPRVANKDCPRRLLLDRHIHRALRFHILTP